MEENISQDQIVGHQNQAKKPWFKIVLFTVLGLVLVGGLVFAVFRIGSQTSPKERACSTEAKICPDGSAVGRTGPNCEFASCPTQAAKDETANWKTYKNTKYGYSIKYPDGWEYLEVPNQTYQSMIDQTWFSDVGWPPPQTGARAPIIIDYSKENPEINYQPEYYDNYKKENITVGDSLSAVKISGYNKEGLMNETIVILPVEGKNYKFLSFLPSFEQEENKNYNTVLNLMLSTFKFLDQAQTDVTTNWKTYINQDFGFSIKYPPHWFFKDKEYLEEGYKMVRLGNFPSLDQGGCPPEEELFPSLMEITIDKNKNRLPLKEWFDEKYKCKEGCAPSPPEFLENIVIGNNRGILAKWDLPGPLGEETKIYFFSHGETVYSIHLYYPPVSDGINKREIFEKTFNFMLSTFRFLLSANSGQGEQKPE